MNVRHFLRRLEYGGPAEPKIETLRALQLAFLLKVPFENLDIIANRAIVLSSEHIYEKIVGRRRGGVCFERNILFHDLLSGLGFQAAFLSARFIKGSRLGREFEHMVLLVSLEHDYLVDVGVGHFCREPLRIDGSDSSSAEGYYYRVGKCDDSYALYYRQKDKEWLPRYLFTETHRLPSEFEPMNRFHQTSPDSSFTRRPVVTIATNEGRISLIGRRLTITEGDSKVNRELESEEEYLSCLAKYFDIEILI